MEHRAGSGRFDGTSSRLAAAPGRVRDLGQHRFFAREPHSCLRLGGGGAGGLIGKGDGGCGREVGGLESGGGGLETGGNGVQGLAVKGLAVKGLAVKGLAAKGLALQGLAVKGLAVKGLAATSPALLSAHRTRQRATTRHLPDGFPQAGGAAAPGANAAPTQSLAALPERPLGGSCGVSLT
jgi:hypothetical protein